MIFWVFLAVVMLVVLFAISQYLAYRKSSNREWIRHFDEREGGDW